MKWDILDLGGPPKLKRTTKISTFFSATGIDKLELSSLTEENPLDQERVQKAAERLIIGEKFEIYEDGLLTAHQESLKERGEKLQIMCEEWKSNDEWYIFNKEN